jgi:hypothetical protein
MQSVGAVESPHNVDCMPNSNGHTKHEQRGEVDIWVVAVMFLIPSSIVTPLVFFSALLRTETIPFEVVGGPGR